jgi:hypothetical protein
MHIVAAHKDKVNADLLDFMKANRQRSIIGGWRNAGAGRSRLALW